MKNLLLLVVVFVTTAKAQDTLVNLPLKDGKIYYERIYQENGTKAELYAKAKNVFLRLFPDTKNVIQNADEDNGIVSGKGYFTFSLKSGIFKINTVCMVKCTIMIVVKDGKYKVDLFDLNGVSKMDLSEQPTEEIYFLTVSKKLKKNYEYYNKMNERALQVFDQIKDEMDKKPITDF